MPDIRDTVGEGAANKSHDVALVQAMLRVVKDAKNQPYLAGNYDGVYGPQTKGALQRFQTDQKLVPPPPGSQDKSTFVNRGGPTVQKLSAMLPAAYKEMTIIEDTKTVFLPGTEAALKASTTSLSGDLKLDGTFRAKVVDLVNQVFKSHKIVLWAGALGRHRSFAEQAALSPTVTKAGPGESNHNFGRAVDLVYKDLQWVARDGGIVKDTPWLEKLAKAHAAKATAFWDQRDVLVYKANLFTLKVAWDRPHVQSFQQSTVSMKRSLVALLNVVGKSKWGAGTTGYKSDLGLGGPLANAGSAKQIFAGSAPVAKADIVSALNGGKMGLAAARDKWAGKALHKAGAAKAVTQADITAADVTAVQKFLKQDFQLADENYLKWKPVP
jgi:peptidoglycan hydrolase-like protein with peptidoglycan-binding domain